MTAMHLCGRSRIGFVALLLLLPLALQAQPGAKKILDRTAEAFRRAGGVEATFSLTGGQGAARGTICLQGEKFRLESGGITTWFDGTTQWSYVAANEEVNVSEPTEEELQTLNPYTLLYIYRQGYSWKTVPARQAAAYAVELKADAADKELQRIVIEVRQSDYRPLYIVMQTGSGDKTEVQVTGYRTGLDFPDGFFRFDEEQYPSAEVIDLR